MWIAVLVTLAAGYLLGNVNGAVCVSRMMNDDVRNHGSGNAGLTNFIRSYGVGSALLVIAVDGGKAIAGTLIGGFLMKAYGEFTDGAALGGAAVMLGHTFPVFLHFRGGKGILSGLFIALIVDWRIAALILAVFLIAYFLTRYVSLGSVLAAVTFGVCFVIFHHDYLIVCVSGVFMSVLATFMHRQNIVRLVRGQERKTDLFKRKS